MTETQEQLSSNGAPGSSSVMQDALLRLLSGQKAASEDRPALAADRLLSHLAFHPAAQKSPVLSLSLATVFPEASASVVAAVPLPPTAALVAAPLNKGRGNSPPLFWRELDLRPPSASSSSRPTCCPLEAALAATLASAPAPGAESLAEAAGAERRGGAAGALQSALGGGANRIAASLAAARSPEASAALAEASSGFWLAEWEAGRHGGVSPPPGLTGLVFSSSSSEEEEEEGQGETVEPAAAKAKPPSSKAALPALLRPSDFFGGGGGDSDSDDEEDYGEAPSTSEDEDEDEDEDEEEEESREEEEEATGGAAAAGSGANADDDEGAADSLLASTAAAAAAKAAAAPRVSARRKRGKDGKTTSGTAAATAASAATSASAASATAAAASASSGGWARRGDPAQLSAAFEALRPRLALRFPFELDNFQKEAIVLMEAGESVFVAAHTSAGKTAVAEYAVALAAAARGKALYCSPIKTISNQKFRDFSSKFDTGLLTGDASVRPEAQCLVLTTEVLRSMLYRGADTVRDVEWVIFDEVHYVNDAERGVVWEEAIMLLPRRAKLVMLSATVPNVDEFAGWCGKTRGRPFWITGTTKRPVPLEHALWFPFGSQSPPAPALSSPSSSSLLSGPAPAAATAAGAPAPVAAKGQAFVVCSESLGWSSKGFSAAKAAWKLAKGGGDKGTAAGATTAKDAKAARPTGRGGGGGGGRGGGAGAAAAGRGRGRGQQQPARGGGAAGSLARATANSNAASGNSSAPRTDAAQWRALIAWLRARDLVPAAFFFFSKKKIDALAGALRSLDLSSGAAEQAEVSGFVARALKRLPAEDRTLPQVLSVADGLKRGVGVHHAGLLPILKEIVEMLFCRGLVKILLCSETFAMGVNAPARAVAFAQLRKHDGAGFRGLLPGEYTQMAGRAGRRGLDRVGSVLVPCLGDSFPPPEELELRRVMTSPGARLESRFRLTPAMILNCARGEDLSVEALMRRSFAEFHAARAAPAAARRAAAARKQVRELDALPWLHGWPRRGDVERYASLTDAADREVLEAAVADAPGVLQALTPGRLVLARTASSSPATLAVVVSSCQARGSGGSGGNSGGRNVGSGNTGSGIGKECILLALVEGDEWPLAEPAEGGEEEGDGERGGSEKKKKDGESAAVAASTSSSLVPLPSKKDDDDPFAGMRRVTSGKKNPGDLDSQLAALSSSSSSAFLSSSSLPSSESLGLPQRAEAAGVSFALVAVAPRLVDAVLSEKLPHLDCDGIVAAAAAAAAAAAGKGADSSSSPLSLSPAAGAAALALRRARDEAAANSKSPPSYYPAPPLDPVSDLRVTGIEASAAARRRADAVAARSALSPTPLPLPPSAALAAALSRVRARRAAASRAREEALAAGGAALEALPEYSARVDALVRLGYLEGNVQARPAGGSGGGGYSSSDDGGDGDGGGGRRPPPRPTASSHSGNGVALKGRVACELAAAHDGLALSEALFAGAFASLASPADAAALLSCYVFQERSKDGEDGDVFACKMPTRALEAAFATAVEAAAAVGRAHEEAGLIGKSGGGISSSSISSSELLPASVEEWVSAALRPGMVWAVHAWASGARFVDVCALTEAMEGTIVRTVMRVDEAARELRDAARVMGDTALWRQMEKVSEAVRRDVAFAASLYVS